MFFFKNCYNRSMKRKLLLLAAIISMSGLFAQKINTDAEPKLFQFKFKENDQSRILTTVIRLLF